MCGRYMITTPFEAMADLFDAVLAEGLGPDAPRPNVSPTETVPVVVSNADGRAIVPMRWGFLPGWYRSLNDGPLLINARAETIAVKPAFRTAVRKRRCLIPADGFYEWRGAKAGKVPFVIRPAVGGAIAFAGVWQTWGAGGLPTCAIVTCDANPACAAVHDRMPVVVAPADFGLWLVEDGTGAAALMRPAPDAALVVEEADAATRAALARRAADQVPA